MAITKSVFGYLHDGSEVSLYSLSNAAGMCVKITDFGGIITELHVPDRQGKFSDIVLGYDDLEHYCADKNYFGALIGRYANRLAQASVVIDGLRYALDKNDGENHLHGGIQGFHKVLWSAHSYDDADNAGLILSYRSSDGEQGYPGNLDVTVSYALNQRNELQIRYQAVTDKATPVNLTQHTYFNLAGHGDILTHELMINADQYTPVGATLLPENRHHPVDSTPFDFRTGRKIGERIDADDRQIHYGKGYDHNFVLNKIVESQPEIAVRVLEPISGRVMEIITREPGMQFYSGNFLNGGQTGKNWNFTYRSGFCLEPQHFPDSPNNPSFPDTIVRPGEVYSTSSIYRFSVQA